MEYLAVSLNPRQGLMAGQRLATRLSRAPGHQPTLATFQAALDQMPWRLYEVRRAVLPAATGAGKTSRAARWLRAYASGTRAQMATALAATAASNKLRVTAEDGIPRAWARRRGEHLPAADWFFVAAPKEQQTKKAPGSPQPGPSPWRAPPKASCSPNRARDPAPDLARAGTRHLMFWICPSRPRTRRGTCSYASGASSGRSPSAGTCTTL